MEGHLNYIYVCCSLSGRSFIIVYFLREGNRVKVKMYDFSLKTRELKFVGTEMRRVGCATRSFPKNFFAKKTYILHVLVLSVLCCRTLWVCRFACRQGEKV